MILLAISKNKNLLELSTFTSKKIQNKGCQLTNLLWSAKVLFCFCFAILRLLNCLQSKYGKKLSNLLPQYCKFALLSRYNVLYGSYHNMYILWTDHLINSTTDTEIDYKCIIDLNIFLIKESK